ncbi:unnamed protein product [Rhizoctonia solani]|uniref:Uncharacterized protein n=1 Tax=Rhizoctonia solani TaxID=456999 RepID=A0A8H3BN52_9AGAM|nr:unnamed protein product [Rhizoctonia solani]
MIYNTGLDEQSFIKASSFDGADAGDFTPSEWFDFDSALLEHAPERSFGEHIPPFPLQDPLLGVDDIYLPLPDPSDLERLLVDYSPQPHSHQTDNKIPCYPAVDDVDETGSLAAPVPSQDLLWSLMSPGGPLVAPDPWGPYYPQDTYGPWPPSAMQAHDTTNDHLRQLDTLLYHLASSNAVTQGEESALSIDPSQMHLPDPVTPFGVDENIVPQEQIASSSTTTVGSLPPESPSRGCKRKISYETPNSFGVLTTTNREIGRNSLLEQCRKYRKIAKDKRITCRCSQDPELRMLNCRGSYKGEHEWKRGHKIERDVT